MRQTLICVSTMAVLFLYAGEALAIQPYVPTYPDPIKEAWRWQAFPSLAGAGLRCLTESSDGVMWFGLDDGVVRYDGTTWARMKVGSSPVNILAAGKKGIVYAGTDTGIFSYRDGKWSGIFPLQPGFPWNIHGLAVDEAGALWAGSEWGLIRVDANLIYAGAVKAEVLRSIAPGLNVRIVPESVVPLRPWSAGLGVRSIAGWGDSDGIIWAVDNATPELRPGDRIRSIDGNPEVLQVYLDGPVGTSAKLAIVQDGGKRTIEHRRRTISGTIGDFSVYDVSVNQDGVLWLGISSRMEGGEIVRYDPRTDTWLLFGLSEGVAKGYRPRVKEGTDRTVWVASFDDTVGVSWGKDRLWQSSKLDSQRNTNPSILEASDGTIWVGGNGRFHQKHEDRWNTYARPHVPIPRARILSMIESLDGMIWMAGRGQEAVRLDYARTRWSTHDRLRFLCDTEDGWQWFLSDEKRLIRNRDGEWQSLGPQDGIIDSPNNGHVLKNGNMLLIGSHEEVAAISVQNGGGWSRRVFPDFAPEIDARTFFESRDGSLWFGALTPWEENQRGGALRVMNETEEYFKPLVQVPNSIRGIGQSADGEMWMVGTGVSRFVENVWRIGEGPPELSRSGLNWINVILSDTKGRIWLGTRSYGVYVYDAKTWQRFGVVEGLADNAIQAMLEDRDGSIWVATDKGISRFDGRAWTTHALGPGLPPIFHTGLRQGQDGSVWLNLRDHRAVRYTPDNQPPETTINVTFGKVIQTDVITVPWSGVDPWKHTSSEDLQYAWRIDRQRWSPFTKNVAQTLPELPSGTHAFQVKARDSDFNEDPTPATLVFEVVPPLWMQPWFIVSVVVLVGVVLVQSTRVLVRDRYLQVANKALGDANLQLFDVNGRLRSRTSELEEAQEKLEELDAMKTNFFSNVSHELRTPMTSIKGYVDNMLDGISGSLNDRQVRYLQRIKSNSDRLARLVNDLLDIQRLSRGQSELLRMKVERIELADAVEEAVEGLRAVAEAEELELHFTGSETVVIADRDRVIQMVTNLVGNAIKFTDRGGEIDVTVKSDGTGFAQTIVRDTGRGIPADELDSIFDRFHQVAGTEGGTGLGLPITKELVELNEGKIWVESEVGVGATFTFALPEPEGR